MSHIAGFFEAAFLGSVPTAVVTMVAGAFFIMGRKAGPKEAIKSWSV